MGEVIPEGVGPEIEKAWETVQETQQHLSLRWQKHANRRTALVALIVAAPFAVFYAMALRPPANFPAGDIISVERDASAASVAQQFEDQRVIRSASVFKLALKLMGGDRNIHAGDYQFNHSKNVLRVAQALMTGDFGLEPVRIYIPAGATAREMAETLGKKLPRLDKEAFVRDALPHEGYLYPDTYFFLPTAKEDVVIRTLRETFEAKIAPIQTDIDAFGRPLSDIIIVASLLEREESDYLDKQKIAGIIWKRLEINMPLQVDATFVYTIGKGSNELTLKDLEEDSPYNTYRNKGLPPGPIANPSVSSIRAAIHPIEQGYLFYLADHTGTTHYSATYEEHLRKKRYYLGS
ncbi:MAG: endolytic transglycosylase MltG [Parcubacteria group bacterium]|nr:endolytic transglycosylase MltG [Parcubacteria group bacterium]